MAEKYAWVVGNSPPEIDEHSLAKHRIYRGYVRQYIQRLTAIPHADRFRFSIIDGFSGGGIYTTGTALVPGSPLIVLEEIRDAKLRLAAERKKPFSLEVDLICIDSARPHCEYLQQLIRNSEFRDQLDKSVFVVHGQFEEKLDSVLQHVSSRGRDPRALFILDQYGYKDAALAVVRRILDEINKSEVLLTFAVDSLINYMADTDQFKKAVRGLEVTDRKLRQLIQLAESDHRYGRWLAENGLYKHFQEATGAPYYTPFFVRSADSNRAYWLLHIQTSDRSRCHG